ncbi:restriction endonuclease subunit S [Acinetobacter baumannii]|nr:restriction endonuclease subunit S [Acinetobacter baumannii]
MQFKQYPSYKNSGVEWLSDVPEHWQIVRTKDIFNHRKEEALEDDEIVTAFRDGQVTLRKNRRTDGFTNSIKEHGYQHINSGDLVIHEMDAFAGAIGVSDSSGKSTPVYTVCYAKNENINHHFYSHFFRTMAKTGFINSLAKGIRVRSTEFRWNESRNVYLVEPPKADQEKIVSFLDTETARIDNLISKQEKLIELLEEQRKSIISHAVTKGLNPNVPMKDSGVEWLGQVPEHWKIGRLKNLLSINNGSDYKEFEVENSENSYPVYGSGGVFTYSSKYIYDQESVLLGRKGTINKPLYVTRPFWAVDTMFYSQVKQGVHGKYVYYQALGFPYDRYSSNTALPSMTQTDLLNLSVAIPLISEQIEITQFLDNENAVFDNLISKQKKLIEKLKEYRSSIISHAVTGKIDVREFGA